MFIVIKMALARSGKKAEIAVKSYLNSDPATPSGLYPRTCVVYSYYFQKIAYRWF